MTRDDAEFDILIYVCDPSEKVGRRDGKERKRRRYGREWAERGGRKEEMKCS